MRHHSWRWSSALLAAPLLVACQGQVETELEPAQGSLDRIPSSYALIDMGTVPGEDFSYPMALNSRSEVTGISGVFYEYSFVNSFYWNPVDGITPLGTVPNYSFVVAADINDGGRIVGSLYSYTENSRAFVWEQGNFSLIDPPPGATYIDAWAINRDGLLVGSTDFTPGTSEAYLLRGDQFVALGVVEGGSQSVALGINDGGEIIGYGDNGAGAFVGLLWVDGGAQMIDLSTVLSVPDFLPYALSEEGQLAGYSPSLEHAVFVEVGGEATDLGSLAGPDGYSQALGVSAAAQVVGGSVTPEDLYHAFVWEDGVMVDLNTLIDPDAGVELIEATDINDAGEIVAVGLSGGAYHGFLLRPQ